MGAKVVSRHLVAELLPRRPGRHCSGVRQCRPQLPRNPLARRFPSWQGPFVLPSGLEGDLVAHPAELFDRAVFGFVGVESGVEVSKPFCHNGIGEWGSRGLNPGPTDYESAALTS